jgi:hypothetical protein
MYCHIEAGVPVAAGDTAAAAAGDTAVAAGDMAAGPELSVGKPCHA